MNDLVEAYVAHMRLAGLRPRTVAARASYLRRVQAWAGRPLAELTPDDLAAWQNTRSRLAPNTRHSEPSHLRAFYRWAQHSGHRPDDPTWALVRTRKPRQVPRPIPEGDLHVALDTAPPDVRLVLVLAAYCGLRAAEIAGLNRADLLEGSDPPVLVVADGKGGHQRVIPLPGPVLAELRRYGLPGRGPVLRRQDGQPGPVAPWRVSQLANTHLHGLGVGHTLHSLRHRAATRWYQAEQDIRAVGEMLGHRSPQSTAGYAAYAAGSASRIAGKVAEELGSPVPAPRDAAHRYRPGSGHATTTGGRDGRGA